MSRDYYDDNRNQKYFDSDLKKYPPDDDRFMPNQSKRNFEETRPSSRARSNSTSRSSSNTRNKNPKDVSYKDLAIKENEANHCFRDDPQEYQQGSKDFNEGHNRISRRQSRSISRSPSPIPHHPGLSHPPGENENSEAYDHTTYSRHELNDNRNWPDDNSRDWDYHYAPSRGRDYYDTGYSYRSRHHRREVELSPDEKTGEREYGRDFRYPRGRHRAYYERYPIISSYHDRGRERDTYRSSRYERPRYSRFHRRDYDWDYEDSRDKDRSREYLRRERSPSPLSFRKNSRLSPDSGFKGRYDPRDRELDRELQLRYGNGLGRNLTRNSSKSPVRSIVRDQTSTEMESKPDSPLRSDRSEEGALTPSPKSITPVKEVPLVNDPSTEMKEELEGKPEEKNKMNELNDINVHLVNEEVEQVKENDKTIKDEVNKINPGIPPSNPTTEVVTEPQALVSTPAIPQYEVSHIQNFGYYAPGFPPQDSTNAIYYAPPNFQAVQPIYPYNNVLQSLPLPQDSIPTYYTFQPIINSNPDVSNPIAQYDQIIHPSTEQINSNNAENDSSIQPELQPNPIRWSAALPSQKDQYENSLFSPPATLKQDNEIPAPPPRQTSEFPLSSSKQDNEFITSSIKQCDEFSASENFNTSNQTNYSKQNSFRSAKEPATRPPTYRDSTRMDPSRIERIPLTNPRYAGIGPRPSHWSGPPRPSPINHNFPRGPSRRPSRNQVPKPQFLLEFESQLYPHPWSEKVNNDFAARKVELLKLEKVNTDFKADLARAKFDLDMMDLEIFCLETALAIPSESDFLEFV